MFYFIEFDSLRNIATCAVTVNRAEQLSITYSVCNKDRIIYDVNMVSYSEIQNKFNASLPKFTF